MKIRVLPEARAEARDATDFYEQHAALGDDFVDELRNGFEAIAKNPALYPVPTGIGSRRGFRGYLMNRFPYQIVYHFAMHEITVVAVAHTRRRPGYWSKRKISS